MVLMANALWRSMSAKSCTEFDVRVSFVSSCSTHHKAVWTEPPTAGVVHDPVRLSFLEPRPDVKRVYTDANQVCWNKAKLRCPKANYADNQAVDN
jgi:hypothetical protein